MTKKEFEAWQEETAKSKDSWQVDKIHCSLADALLYKGGENGRYIHLHYSLVECGTYTGAIPHVGNALFSIEVSHNFGNVSEAWATVSELVGKDGKDLYIKFGGESNEN